MEIDDFSFRLLQDNETNYNASTILQVIPIRDSLFIVIPLTIVYSIILLTGLSGNIITCVVIYKISYMHTSTNYYLFSLAISDLLLLLCGLPQEMYLIWFRYPYIFGEAFCILRGFTAETSANATVLTITAFTVERFVAVSYPLKTHKLSKLSRVIRAIIFIWIISFILAIPQAVQFGVVDEVSSQIVVIPDAWCSIKRGILYAFEISICLFFVVPMTIITVLYVLIGLKLRRSHGPSRLNQEQTVETRFPTYRSQSHVIRMLVAVVVAFFISYAPFHAQRLLAIYAHGTSSRTIVSIYDFITHVSGILYFLSTCVNPILYHIMSNKFRQAFKDTISQYCGRDSRRTNQSELGIIRFRQVRRVSREREPCQTCRNSTRCSCNGKSHFLQSRRDRERV